MGHYPLCMRVFTQQFEKFTWIDCEAPSQEDLMHIADETDLPLKWLSICLDSEHLPKFEQLGSAFMLILRSYDFESHAMADTPQELSSKLVAFIKSDLLVTLHRAPKSFIQEKREKCAFETYQTPYQLIGHFADCCFKSFDPIITEMEARTDAIEDRVYALKKNKILRDGYIVKRKTGALRKLFKMSQDAMQRYASHPEICWTEFNDSKSYLDRLTFYADDIIENLSGLMNLHINLLSQQTNEASYKTNEVMRVLTIFSIFFLPLNFIAGVYGMNFKVMPELEFEYGYYLTLGLMIAIGVGIYIWIKRKGWLST